MRTKAIFGFWGSLVFAILCLSGTEELFAQQIIKLKDGQKIIADLKYQSRDTLYYQLFLKPKVNHWVLTDQVETIKNLRPAQRNFPDTIPPEKQAELYLKNKNIRDAGLGFVIGGAVVTGLGLALFIPAAVEEFKLFSASEEWAHDQLSSGAIISVVGAVGLITGSVLAMAGGTKMKKYSTRPHRFSLDFNCAPQNKGISLVYRF